MEKSMISLCLLGGLAIGNGFAQTPSKPSALYVIPYALSLFGRAH